MSVTRKRDYEGKVQAGYAAMKGRKVAICGLARDCALNLPRNIKTIERLRKYFQVSYVVVVENDSRDRTKEILKNWSAARKDVFVLSQDTGEFTTPAQSPGQIRPWFSKHRIERFVKFRNMYLDYVENNIDFVVSQLPRLIPMIKAVRPDASFLVWLDCRELKNVGIEDIPGFFTDAGLALNDGAMFGPGGEGFMRLNAGCSKAILEQALEKLYNHYRKITS